MCADATEGFVPRISPDAIGPDNPPDAKDAFELLVHGASEYAVFTLSPDGLVSTWNVGAAGIKGYQDHEIIGRHFSVFYTQADKDAEVPDALLQQAIRDGRVETEGWRVRADGSQFWASVLITPLWDAANGLRGFAKLTRDDSDRLEATKTYEMYVRIAEQERIAANLADSLVHGIFAIGLEVAGALKLSADREVIVRLEAAVIEVDEIIERIRRSVFD